MTVALWSVGAGRSPTNFVHEPRPCRSVAAKAVAGFCPVAVLPSCPATPVDALAPVVAANGHGDRTTRYAFGGRVRIDPSRRTARRAPARVLVASPRAPVHTHTAWNLWRFVRCSPHWFVSVLARGVQLPRGPVAWRQPLQLTDLCCQGYVSGNARSRHESRAPRCLTRTRRRSNRSKHYNCCFINLSNSYCDRVAVQRSAAVEP